eukprot:15350394-Ditylum_brightwellii.AAC.2
MGTVCKYSLRLVGNIAGCQINQKPAMYNHKVLEKEKGFAMHMEKIYFMIHTYYKGVNITIESW